MSGSLETYDEWHRTHATGHGVWYEMAAEVLIESRWVVAGARVLEIGCGLGDFSAWMLAQGAKSVVGEDFSSVAIEYARARHAETGVLFEVGDIQDLAHPAGVFDLVVSCETIEHVPAPSRAVRELGRVLRPGGTLLLSTPNYLSLAGLGRLIQEAKGLKWDEGGQPIVNWTMYPKTAWWVRSAGLSIRSTRGDNWVLPLPGRPNGLVLTPPPRFRRWIKLGARHILLEARKPDAVAR